MSTSVMWLVAGAFFICIEIFGMPGIGFLFAGIAAIIVGGSIEAGLIEPSAMILHFVLFFAITCLSAALMWKTLKKRTVTAEPKYHNMVGTEGIVADGGLTGTQVGQVKWSGTLMRARLAADAGVDVLPEATVVVIRRVEGNLLYVAPKHH